MRFSIIIRGRDCAKYIKECLDSIIAQTHKDWVATVCLDSPTDNSYEKAIKYTRDRRIRVFRNRKRLGVAGNLVETMMLAAPSDDDIIAVVDADDAITPKSLERRNKAYVKNHNLQLTYGSFWRMDYKRRTKTSRRYRNGVSVRKQTWHGSHLKTFKYSLYKLIPVDYFKYKRKNSNHVVWFEAASDIALMLPLFDLIGVDRYKTHTKWFRDTDYLWRRTDKKTRGHDQFRCKKIAKKKTPLERLEVL